MANASVQAEGTNPQGMGHDEPGWPLGGPTGRFDARGQEDDFTQAGNLFRLLPADEQSRLCANMAASLSKVSPEIRARWLVHLFHAEKSYGDGVCQALAQQEPA